MICMSVVLVEEAHQILKGPKALAANKVSNRLPLGEWMMNDE